MIDLYAHATGIIRKAEAVAKVGSIVDVLRTLRRLSLSDFGSLMWNLPMVEYPEISKILPRMASDQIQRTFTGTSGNELLIQTLAFVLGVSYHYREFTGRSIKDRTLLDFGCGYGRLIRLMYYYTDPGNIWGVDALELPLDICRQDNVCANLGLSQYLPTQLPIAPMKFDAIYAFSVLTHSSERATKSVMRTLRGYLAPGGICVVTVRPKEYWSSQLDLRERRDCLELCHEERGFSFVPWQRPAVDGDLATGRTTIALRWLARECPEWEIVFHDRSLVDPLQRVVYLAARD